MKRKSFFILLTGYLLFPAAFPSSANNSSLPLVYQNDLNYIGAFKVPSENIGESKFKGYIAGIAPAFNPVNNSLFISGHVVDQAIAEITIPAQPVNSSNINNLPMATVLQPFVKIPARIPNYYSLLGSSGGGYNLGGLMVIGGQLVGTAYNFYDSSHTAQASHYMFSSHNLATATGSGLFRVGSSLNSGYYGGYMAAIPSEWQTDLGAPYLTGQAGISIASRTSQGPAAFGFNPSDFGSEPAPAIPYVYYTIEDPLAGSYEANPLWNRKSKLEGAIFVKNSRSILFFGTHGQGSLCYGTGGTSGECYDPADSSKGYHAYPYVNQVWAYDALDFVAVKNGSKLPWEIQPYDTWTFDFPIISETKRIGGAAVDSATGRVFVIQQSVGPDTTPLIHVYQISTEPDTTPPTISALNIMNVKANSVEIIWNTNEAANSIVEYGQSPNFGSLVNGSLFVTSHRMLLSGLQASTTYNYRITSEDPSGNATTSPTSGTLTFTTTPQEQPSAPSAPTNLHVIQ